MNLEQFKKFLHQYGIVKNDAYQNAQILVHGVGQTGANNIEQIKNEGLWLQYGRNDNKNGRRGVLSTCYLCNDLQDNTVDWSTLDNYYHGTGFDQYGYGYNVIMAIPQQLGNYYLGRVLPDQKNTFNINRHHQGNHKGYNCLLDDLGMQKIPSEFIVGLCQIDRRSGKQNYLLNPTHYAVNQESCEQAKKFVGNLVKDYHGDQVIADMVLGKCNFDASIFYHLAGDPRLAHEHIFDTARHFLSLNVQRELI